MVDRRVLRPLYSAQSGERVVHRNMYWLQTKIVPLSNGLLGDLERIGMREG
jgi:hypothetical protein